MDWYGRNGKEGLGRESWGEECTVEERIGTAEMVWSNQVGMGLVGTGGERQKWFRAKRCGRDRRGLEGTALVRDGGERMGMAEMERNVIERKGGGRRGMDGYGRSDLERIGGAGWGMDRQ